MKKVLLAAALIATASGVWAQTGTVPPDYPEQQAQYYANPVDAQIEAVRRNYEDVKARAQSRLDAQRRAKAEAAEREAEAKARAQARERAAAAARAKETARKAAKEEKYRDQARELELEMRRMDVESKRSDLEVKQAINREKVLRAGEIVEREILMPAKQ